MRGSDGTSPTMAGASSTSSACSCSRCAMAMRPICRAAGHVYAEKIMISRKDQLSPMHRHNVKAEDIINRGGARWRSKLFKSDAEGRIDRQAEVGRYRRHDPPEGPGEHAAAEARRERHADAGRLACLLGRGRRRADRRGLDGQQRPDRQHLRRAHRALLRTSRRTCRRCTCWCRTIRAGSGNRAEQTPICTRCAMLSSV